MANSQFCIGKRTICFLGVMIFVLAGWAVYADDPIPATICDINEGNGIYEGDFVVVEGVCTVESARFGNSLTLIGEPQGGPYCCGLAIYDIDQNLNMERGQCIRVCGIVTLYYDKMEIVLDPDYPPPEVWDCEWTVPEPERITTCDMDFVPYTSCLMILECLTVLENPDQFGNQALEDKYGCRRTMALRAIDPPLIIGTEICSITGFMDFHFGEFKFFTRDEIDLDLRPHSECPYCEEVCDPVEIDAAMNIEAPEPITGGDPFIHTVTWRNPCDARDAVLFDLLEIDGMFWFWPTWTTDVNYKLHTLPKFNSYAEEILNFQWPEDISVEIHGRFWTAAMDPASGSLISDIVFVDFCTH